MARSARWISVIAVAATVVGVATAFAVATPRSHVASGVVPAVTTGATSAESVATKSVIDSANRLSEAIGRVSAQTSKGLAASYAALARANAERARLSTEQQLINAEARQLSARVAAITAESAMLQREATTLASARHTTIATSTTASRSDGASAGGTHYDN